MQCINLQLFWNDCFLHNAPIFQYNYKNYFIATNTIVRMSFRISCKPYFTYKSSFGDSKIVLNKNGEILTENIKIAKNKKLSFQCVSAATFRKVVKSLPLDKAIVGDIPVNVLKISKIYFLELTLLTK